MTTTLVDKPELSQGSDWTGQMSGIGHRVSSSDHKLFYILLIGIQDLGAGG